MKLSIQPRLSMRLVQKHTFHCGSMKKAFELVNNFPPSVKKEIIKMVDTPSDDCLDSILFYCFPEVSERFKKATLEGTWSKKGVVEGPLRTIKPTEEDLEEIYMREIFSPKEISLMEKILCELFIPLLYKTNTLYKLTEIPRVM